MLPLTYATPILTSLTNPNPNYCNTSIPNLHTLTLCLYHPNLPSYHTPLPPHPGSNSINLFSSIARQSFHTATNLTLK